MGTTGETAMGRAAAKSFVLLGAQMRAGPHGAALWTAALLMVDLVASPFGRRILDRPTGRL